MLDSTPQEKEIDDEFKVGDDFRGARYIEVLPIRNCLLYALIASICQLMRT